ncbi:hypothetical protein MBRA1_001858 [Malassezia brasiliensis]|uniref:Uncharacterized protein n=1 Tax=Malassezia brasiliensis TaxID=1821822 RepID=A0AAF0DT37_9BASI|nr:hypothetical protein MBRA1_001858 [Malassezia brasiliensis]
MPNRRTPRPVRTALLVVGVALLAGAAARHWIAPPNPRRDASDKPRRSAKKNPALSVSLPLAMDAEAACAQGAETLFVQLAHDFVVHALVHAPSGIKPALPGVDALRVLPYSNAEGRAMLARALQCQCHLEVLSVDASGTVHVSAGGDADVPAYLLRLEQIARAVDMLVLAFVRAPDAPFSDADAVHTALSAHSVAQRPNVRHGGAA